MHSAGRYTPRLLVATLVAVGFALLAGCSPDDRPTRAVQARPGPPLLARALGLDHPPHPAQAYGYLLVGSSREMPGAFLVAFDLHDSRHPVRIASREFESAESALALAPGARVLAFATLSSELITVPLTTTAQPLTVAVLTLPAPPTCVVGAGSLAFVALGTPGLGLVDLADPARPRLLDVTTGPYDAGAVDVDRPERPTLASVIGTDRATGQDGVWLVDVRSPAHPVTVGSISTGRRASHLAIAGAPGRVYATAEHLSVALSEGYRVLEAIDTTDPSEPTALGFVPPPAGASAPDPIDAWATPAGVLARFPGGWWSYGRADLLPLAAPDDERTIVPRDRLAIDGALAWHGELVVAASIDAAGAHLAIFRMGRDLHLTPEGQALVALPLSVRRGAESRPLSIALYVP